MSASGHRTSAIVARVIRRQLAWALAIVLIATGAFATDAAGTPTANLLTGGTDQTFSRTDAAGTRTFLTDALGSTVALVDGTGAITTSYTYEPYGKTTVTGTASTNAQQFTGRENDGPLYFYRARYLHPTFGRFISEDPAGFAAGDPNLYAYVGGSPTNATDPSGMIAPIIAACAAGAAFSVAFDLVGNFLGGRKNDLGDLLGSAATGCVAGLAGFGLGRALGGASKALEKAIGKGAGAVAEGAGAAFNIAERQLQSKFLKHAADFGITGPWNKANAQVFREAIGQHVRNAPGTAGSFRGQSGTWYLNPNTRVGVFADEVGNFVTGFRLSDLQLQHFPRLGGG